MCGIAGILGRLDPPNRQAVKRMTDTLARGPDGEGLWISPANGGGSGVLLGHRRLAVLDLSTAADQPMVDPSTGDALITNGEIYNYRELRNQLRSDGEHFEWTGDTAVMLRVLAHGGPAAVRRLHGMYAFAFWDVSLRQLTLARDPLGIKPLYYILNPERDGDWSVLFASEVRAILVPHLGLVGRPRSNPAGARLHCVERILRQPRNGGRRRSVARAGRDPRVRRGGQRRQARADVADPSLGGA